MEVNSVNYYLILVVSLNFEHWFKINFVNLSWVICYDWVMITELMFRIDDAYLYSMGDLDVALDEKNIKMVSICIKGNNWTLLIWNAIPFFLGAKLQENLLLSLWLYKKILSQQT